MDASSNRSKMATDLTIARIAQARLSPMDTLAVISGLQKTWNRLDAMELANLPADHPMPHYRVLIESYQKAQDIAKSAGA